MATGAAYDCNFSASVTGNAGDTVATTVRASGSSLTTPLSAMSTGNVVVGDVLPSIAVQQHAWPAVSMPGSSVMFVVGVENTGSAGAILLSGLADDVNGNLNGQGDCLFPHSITPATRAPVLT